jgi:hypothetical protein
LEVVAVVALVMTVQDGQADQAVELVLEMPPAAREP